MLPIIFVFGRSMSTQRGSASRQRPQKHQNGKVFKNNLYDTSHRTKFINNIQVCDVCVRCKQIIEWKIKYKKYKPLSKPKTCVRCGERKVVKAYHVICKDCGVALQVCTKCCEVKDVVSGGPDKEEQVKLDAELQVVLQQLPERKRRTFLRHMNKKEEDKSCGEIDHRKVTEDLLCKLKSLKIKKDAGTGESDSDCDEDSYNSSDD